MSGVYPGKISTQRDLGSFGRETSFSLKAEGKTGERRMEKALPSFPKTTHKMFFPSNAHKKGGYDGQVQL